MGEKLTKIHLHLDLSWLPGVQTSFMYMWSSHMKMDLLVNNFHTGLFCIQVLPPGFFEDCHGHMNNFSGINFQILNVPKYSFLNLTYSTILTSLAATLPTPLSKLPCCHNSCSYCVLSFLSEKLPCGTKQTESFIFWYWSYEVNESNYWVTNPLVTQIFAVHCFCQN